MKLDPSASLLGLWADNSKHIQRPQGLSVYGSGLGMTCMNLHCHWCKEGEKYQRRAWSQVRRRSPSEAQVAADHCPADAAFWPASALPHHSPASPWAQ